MTNIRSQFAGRAAIRTLTFVVAMTVAGCTGTASQDTTGTTGATGTTGLVVVDFDQIAGDWTGTAAGSHEVLSIEATIEPSEGSIIVAEGTSVGTTNTRPCEWLWWAESADPPEFEVRETVRSGPCQNGLVFLRYDSETETIEYGMRSDLGHVGDTRGSLTRAGD